jgi:hypothetical protein
MALFKAMTERPPGTGEAKAFRSDEGRSPTGILPVVVLHIPCRMEQISDLLDDFRIVADLSSPNDPNPW